ncbi:MAG: porphobilinogen synthase [Dissulfurimicrobium sp.]|uniref:porphobilinogen synthase n=1 Tax=Dissulfurimicrobium sp. TaxID=2022436 RepID=UPI00404AA133
MMYPEYRPRRLRRSEALRAMVRETELSVKHLVYPLFISPGTGIKDPIDAMPGCFHFSVDSSVEEAKEVFDLGVPAVILFGLPEHKDARGTEAWAQHGVVQKAVSAIKKAVPELIIITDVCLCGYTSHGHCGVISKGEVENDATLEALAKISLSHAKAGVDMVAPSDMMDGRVGAIRKVLDEHGFDHIPIMSYAVKYASAFYGPFREAAENTPQFGDRRSYQMDPPNQREALREAILDLEEGADILMVKPAMPYMDIIHLLRQEFILPIAAYQVSGEYSMIKAAAQNGWIDEARVMEESLIGIRRAGADIIITYFAKDYAKIKNGRS